MVSSISLPGPARLNLLLKLDTRQIRVDYNLLQCLRFCCNDYKSLANRHSCGVCKTYVPSYATYILIKGLLLADVPLSILTKISDRRTCRAQALQLFPAGFETCITDSKLRSQSLHWKRTHYDYKIIDHYMFPIQGLIVYLNHLVNNSCPGCPVFAQ
jgi:hypothetical protein